MANNQSLKISKEAKEFLAKLMVNRIKLDQPPLNSFSEAIELIQKYFNSNNQEYIKMLKEIKNV